MYDSVRSTVAAAIRNVVINAQPDEHGDKSKEAMAFVGRTMGWLIEEFLKLVQIAALYNAKACREILDQSLININNMLLAVKVMERAQEETRRTAISVVVDNATKN